MVAGFDDARIDPRLPSAIVGVDVPIHADRHVQHAIDGNSAAAFPVAAIARDRRVHFAIVIHEVLQLSGQRQRIASRYLVERDISSHRSKTGAIVDRGVESIVL